MITIIKEIKQLQETLSKVRQQNQSIGFVPSMGALHRGHIRLVEKAVADNDCAVVSIFVNPIQFNNPDDLKKYPRNLDKDVEKLEAAGCDYVFVPSVEEMYPDKETKVYDFGDLDKVMEGKFRPGHFNGVGVVVDKLFDIVKPDRAYFGKKDYQQLAIVKRMVEIENHDLEIIPCETVREEDGLAMSSRNLRLNEIQRREATTIYKSLVFALENYKNYSPDELTEKVFTLIDENPEIRVEYVEIVDSVRLQKINSWDDANHAVICVAAYMGEVRLIDNMELF